MSTDLRIAFETSCFLAEKTAQASRPDLREKSAMADFAAFGLFKTAAINPEAIAALQKGLGWGVGLGLPALGVGHLLARSARHQGDELIRNARNQALLTAAGVGGMQALGGLIKSRLEGPVGPSPVYPELDSSQKLAAAIMVDDVLEELYNQPDEAVKHAALVQLIVHRGDSMKILRDWLQ